MYMDKIEKYSNVTPPGYVYLTNAPGYDSEVGPLDKDILRERVKLMMHIPLEDTLVMDNVVANSRYTVFVKNQWIERVANFHEHAHNEMIARNEIAEKLRAEIEGLLTQIEARQSKAEDKNLLSDEERAKALELTARTLNIMKEN